MVRQSSESKQDGPSRPEVLEQLHPVELEAPTFEGVPGRLKVVYELFEAGDSRKEMPLADGGSLTAGRSLAQILDEEGSLKFILPDPIWGLEHEIDLTHLQGLDPDRTIVDISFEFLAADPFVEPRGYTPQSEFDMGIALAKDHREPRARSYHVVSDIVIP